MINAQFKQLCRSTGLILNLTNVDTLGEGRETMIDGLEVALHFDEDIAADRIFCYIRIGGLKEPHDASALRTLMQYNLTHGTRISGVYGLDAQHNNAVFAVHLNDPDALDEHALANVLRFFTRHVNNVRASLISHLH